MSSRRKRLLTLVVLVAVALVVLGTVNGNRVSTTVGSWEVVAETSNVLRGATLTIQPDAAVIEFREQRVEIAGGAVKLPDGTALVVPAGCRRIDLEEQGDAVRVLFDGQPAN
jgi:hypothetical protein